MSFMGTEQNICYKSLNVQPKNADEHVSYQTLGKEERKDSVFASVEILLTFRLYDYCKL